MARWGKPPLAELRHARALRRYLRGASEVALAKRASARLLQLLNANNFVVQSSGKDRYGRTLATIRIDGQDVGDILIDDGLARRWPDGEEFWC